MLTELDKIGPTFSFREAVVHDQIICLLEVQPNAIAGKIFPWDRSFALRRDISEDIGQRRRERGRQREELGMELTEIG